MAELLTDPPRMEKDREEMSKRIFRLTLEILRLLTGEDYTIVKKTWGECVAPSSHLYESGEWSRARGPIMEPPPHSLIHEEKILELTHKITELLTGEVRIRCQHVAVYFSMEEWEYVKGHKDLYQDMVMMENDPQEMDEDRNQMAAEILVLTIEMIYLISGEAYTIMKKSTGESVTPYESEGKSRTRGPIAEPPPHSLIDEKKILEVTHRITELLTGKVPIRCQDVAVYFSMEEWEYVEGHKDQYQDIVMMEDQRPLTSQDGVMDRNPPERCPRPLNSQDCPEGNVPEKHQGEDLIDIKVEVKDEAEEETNFWANQQNGVMDRNPPERCPCLLYSKDCPEGNVPEKHQGGDLTNNKVETDEEESMRGHHPCMREVTEEIPGGVTPENCSNNSEGCFMLSLIYKSEDEDIVQCSIGENPLTLNVHPGLHSTDLSYNPHNHEEPSPDQPHILTTSTDQKGTKIIQCKECGKEFTKRSGLYRHKKCHTGEKPYSCSECGKCFAQKPHLVSHEIVHTEHKPYSCSECGKCFRNKSYLVIHKRNHTGEKAHSCSECGKCFITNFYLKNHLRSHTGEKPYSCSVCGKCFAQKTHLVTHERSHTGEKPYSCSECGKCFTQKTHLFSHERIHTGEKPFSCSECGKCFINKSHLDKHEKLHTGEKLFSCLECGKWFAKKSNLATHERVHTGEKPYSCAECGKSFAKKSNLVIHERIHTGEKPYSCAECGKCFKRKSELVLHKRNHTGEKPYSCLKCGKWFSKKSNLLIHETIHTGEKPYSCAECGKCFVRKADLVQHERIHSGEKPYSCLECGKCFTRKADLVQHERIHTGEKPYLCSECGKSFITKGALKKHQKSHTGEKPYSCSECGKCFITNSTLKKHKRTHTEEKILIL